MKLGFNNFWIEWNIKQIWVQVKNKLQNCRENFKNKFIKKRYTIAFVDDRYHTKGDYVISYCILFISWQKLEGLCGEQLDWEEWLAKEENQKYVVKYSDELNGYETNIPTDFDKIIKV